ncbi:MAG: YgjP-like metallopeptidase domain-containing protein, partial [Pseudomonadota bacterium]
MRATMGRHVRKGRGNGTIALSVSGLPAPVEVRRHPSARRMTLRVSRTRRAVIVTLPPKCDLAQADDFLSTHIDWVRERLHNIPEAQPFADGAVIPLRGTPHLVIFGGSKRGRGVVELTRTAEGQPAIMVHGAAEFAPRRLRDWLVREAKQDLDVAVARHAGRLSLKPNRITVRDQVTRWGSCSSTGNLSFSWRLVMAPPTILDFVGCHVIE